MSDDSKESVTVAVSLHTQGDRCFTAGDKVRREIVRLADQEPNFTECFAKKGFDINQMVLNLLISIACFQEAQKLWSGTNEAVECQRRIQEAQNNVDAIIAILNKKQIHFSCQEFRKWLTQVNGLPGWLNVAEMERRFGNWLDGSVGLVAQSTGSSEDFKPVFVRPEVSTNTLSARVAPLPSAAALPQPVQQPQSLSAPKVSKKGAIFGYALMILAIAALITVNIVFPPAMLLTAIIAGLTYLAGYLIKQNSEWMQHLKKTDPGLAKAVAIAELVAALLLMLVCPPLIAMAKGNSIAAFFASFFSVPANTVTTVVVVASGSGTAVWAAAVTIPEANHDVPQSQAQSGLTTAVVGTSTESEGLIYAPPPAPIPSSSSQEKLNTDAVRSASFNDSLSAIVAYDSIDYDTNETQFVDEKVIHVGRTTYQSQFPRGIPRKPKGNAPQHNEVLGQLGRDVEQTPAHHPVPRSRVEFRT